MRKSIDRKVRGVEDIELLSSIPIYGLLPDKNKSDNIFHESLRRVRANIQFIAPNGKRAIKLLISSAIVANEQDN